MITPENNLGKPTIEVAIDHVIIQGVLVPRPPGIAPSQWLDFWNKVKG